MIHSGLLSSHQRNLNPLGPEGGQPWGSLLDPGFSSYLPSDLGQVTSLFLIVLFLPHGGLTFKHSNNKLMKGGLRFYEVL